MLRARLYRVLLLMAAVMLIAGGAAREPVVQAAVNGSLGTAFGSAAREFDVPVDLLLTVAYVETRFDDRNGEPSRDNGFGLLHLVDNPAVQTLATAAALLRVPPDALRSDPAQNIRGGAALLRTYADEQRLDVAARRNLAAWYPIIVRMSNATDPVAARAYADEVYTLLNTGLSARSPDGETLTVAPRAVEPAPNDASTPDLVRAASLDYAPATWIEAYAGNYLVADRNRDYPVRTIVIHTAECTTTCAVSWFRNPSANVSAHYIVSHTGAVTQMVREKDVAFHAGVWQTNTESIGIEHEGYVNNPGVWYTDEMYRASAALVRDLAQTYGIPLDRLHIKAHSEISAVKSDPGPGWNWTYYMQLVTNATPPAPPPIDEPAPSLPISGYLPLVAGTARWSTIVDNASGDSFTAGTGWDTAVYNTQRLGVDYRVATPLVGADPAWFSATVPELGLYDVYVWYPSGPAYNSTTPFVVATAAGYQYIHIDQRSNGGRWVSLGQFELAAGRRQVVGVSRWSSADGYVVADAVMLVQR